MVQGSRRRGRIFIILALILILAVVLVWVLMRNTGGVPIAQNQPTVAPVDMVDIVITTQAVTRGTIFTETALTTIRYPRGDIVEGTFYTTPVEVIGKRAKQDLAPRTPVTTSVVLDTVDASFAAFQIPQGMVAVSLPINRLTSVSYAPRAGDHVNIIATMLFVDLDLDFQSRLPNLTAGVVAPGPDIVLGSDTGSALGALSLGQTPERNLTAQSVSGGLFSPEGRAQDSAFGRMYLVPSETQRPRMVSQTLLQDAIVLQMGNFILPEEEIATTAQATPTPGPEGEQEAAPAVEIEPPDLITVIVSPQDAVTLNYLLYSGAQLTLALRGAGDDQRVQTEAVTLQYLMDQYLIPVPAKLPYGMEPRQDLLVPSIPKFDPTPVPQ